MDLLCTINERQSRPFPIGIWLGIKRRLLPGEPGGDALKACSDFPALTGAQVRSRLQAAREGSHEEKIEQRPAFAAVRRPLRIGGEHRALGAGAEGGEQFRPKFRRIAGDASLAGRDAREGVLKRGK